MFIIDH